MRTSARNINARRRAICKAANDNVYDREEAWKSIRFALLLVLFLIKNSKGIIFVLKRLFRLLFCRKVSHRLMRS